MLQRSLNYLSRSFTCLIDQWYHDNICVSVIKMPSLVFLWSWWVSYKTCTQDVIFRANLLCKIFSPFKPMFIDREVDLKFSVFIEIAPTNNVRVWFLWWTIHMRLDLPPYLIQEPNFLINTSSNASTRHEFFLYC